ncbi:hypothetical protein L1Z01_21015 [Acinetobacter baumannii]|uniref:Uncharacterized protein n=1 Tax=Acinetobacter baumannii TaxID=470 RepID=A0A241ZB20_ACIBA|nr:MULTISPECIES: hypothetical protein [Acinetobacter calcoaceticus/baumannii complex]AVN30041.1 hypothetical protein AM467_11645 [Acinetobacter baumannii]EKU7211253.1 hypothetical protein [Acinetobacter baumannii]EKW1051592.1 hypothetical protein [Acinetobacter baumannii]EKW6909140.1 hypothetical protein [Acinetobacter baumannii]ENW16697.1 hypothetical protein F928_00131 [Acinetobacter pittii ATCC 19004 = CIP 70.29]
MSEIKGTLPKALKKLVGQTDIKSRNIVMRQPTAIEYLEAQAKIGIGQFVHIADLAAMTKLVDDEGNEHEITYDMLGHSSRANLKYLEGLRDALDAKEAAESSEQEQESSED